MVESLINFQLFRFRARGFARVRRQAVGAAEGRGDALLAVEDGAQSLPAPMNTVLRKAFANNLDGLVGQQGDEQVALDAVFGYRSAVPPLR